MPCPPQQQPVRTEKAAPGRLFTGSVSQSARLNLDAGKTEVGVLVVACKREHVHCGSVILGYGKNIIKQQTLL